MKQGLTYQLPVQEVGPTWPPEALRITVIAGPDAGRSEIVDRPRVVIGRGEEADLRLDDMTVSSAHLELCPTEQGILACDLGSRNGIRMAGVLVERAIVPPGCTFSLGETVLRVEAAARDAPSGVRGAAFGELVGDAPAMRELYTLLARLAGTDLTLLIEGETGTGKELAARAVRGAGPRAAGPFVVLDCTAIPPTLAASLLFGHEKGSFTGATERRIGLFEAAAGGTLLMDEIGELAPELQPLLLRVLQQREFTPVGSTKPRRVDVRVISTTWRDLRDMVDKGSFREDLYHRVAQARVWMPSLSERKEDIELLCRHFLSRIPVGVRAARDMTEEALSALTGRRYPGNVRDLQNTVERLAVLAQGPQISRADIDFEAVLSTARSAPRPRPEATFLAPGGRGAPGPPGRPTAFGRVGPGGSGAPIGEAAPEAAAPPGAPAPEELLPYKEAKRVASDAFERAYLTQLLQLCGDNLTRAARVAGLERHNLRELLKRHGLYAARE